MVVSYNKFRYILVAILFVVLLVIIVWKWTFRPAESSVEDLKTDVTIESSALIQNFTMNEDSANSLYLNKVILVSGVVESVSEKEQETTVYLKSANDPAGILCSFDKTAFTSESLKVGEKVSIKGLCTGYLMDVVLNKCAIEK